MSSKRENKGINIIEQGLIKKQSDAEYLVKSNKTSEIWYKISWKAKTWTCNCLDFQNNNQKCKHIYAVNYYLKIGKIRTGAGKYLEYVCPVCNKDDHVIKRGKRYNRTGAVQRYYCKRCQKRFSGRPAFKHMKHKIETIVTAIDLYYRGLSLRQITEHMQSTQKTKISHTTIQNWIKKYVSLLTQYMQDLKPNTSDRWHADETLIPVSGRHLRLWALLDSDTRFLIASHISKKQTTEDARILFKKGKERTEKCPSEIVTDGLSAYPKAIKAEIATSIENPVIHLHSSLTKAYNNKMERLMGTIKYRTKPMLGLYDKNSADFFSDAFSIYYNYIRNHISLNNQTPAVAAGIMKDKMTWLDLIEKTENNILSNNRKRDGCS